MACARWNRGTVRAHRSGSTIADTAVVIDAGKIVERGKTGEVLDKPQSDAAKALVVAAPDLQRALERRLARENNQL